MRNLQFYNRKGGNQESCLTGDHKNEYLVIADEMSVNLDKYDLEREAQTNPKKEERRRRFNCNDEKDAEEYTLFQKLLLCSITVKSTCIVNHKG